jgi:rhodanese-related sulfurtransferase
MYTGMILDNAIHRGRQLISAGALDTLIQSRKRIQLFDVRSPAQYLAEHIETAVNIPQEKLRERLSSLDKDASTVTYCNKGVTGNAAQNILINKGFKTVYTISGGNRTYHKLIDTQEHNHRKYGKR